MFSRLAFRLVDVLLIVTLLVAAVASAIEVLNVADSAPSISVGQRTGTASQGQAVLQVTIVVLNGGQLTADDVSISVRITDTSNNTVVSGSVGPLSIPPGKTVRLNPPLGFDLQNLPSESILNLLTSDQDLRVFARVTTALRPFIDVAGSANGTISWGAPLNGLTFDRGSISSRNLTYSLVTRSNTFKDDSRYITVNATGSGILSVPGGPRVGLVRPFSMMALPGKSGGGTLSALVENSAIATSGNSITALLQIHSSYGVDVPVTVVLSA